MATRLVSPVDSSNQSDPEARIKQYPVSFWREATFLPLDQPSKSDALLDEVCRYHQAAFLAFNLKLSATEPELCERTGISACFEKFKMMAPDERRRLIEYPPFLIWLKQVRQRYAYGNDLNERLADLKRVMESFDRIENDPSALTIPGTRIRVARFDVDPLIMEAALPEYRFPDIRRQREFEEAVAYPPSFFLDMVTLALERIGRAWPPARREFDRFVSLIIDMVDADFTSYSAYHHVGVIFVSTDNSPLVALEEYLIHELGHQILYNVMELDPVVINEPERMFRLPWSGQERDLYGYFHAFYIYIFMTHYLKRVERRSNREQRRVRDRISHIMKGLDLAASELEAIDRFTPAGKHLFENLKRSGLEIETTRK
ncbi:MAG TPA: HEXXH motif-containing putative peptide modification protein [Blastocatellia bacterium]|nr:HEXXH motif-containing putative peptide modification protein [Blastocatellia bacterium]